jgi:excisionase family DNA binding protein
MMKTPLTDLPPTFLTKAHACHYSGLCVRTIDAAREAGHLPSYKVGRRVLIRREDLDAYLERCRVPVGADEVDDGTPSE